MFSKPYKVTREIFVSAPPKAVFDVMADFKRFKDWSPWQKRDLHLKETIDGAPGTVGSNYRWTGNKQVGEGSMRMTRVDAPRTVEIALEFLKPFQSRCKTTWSVAPQGGEGKGSVVTWSMEGERTKLIEHVMGFIFNMDKLIGKDFDEGLENLKRIIEGK